MKNPTRFLVVALAALVLSGQAAAQADITGQFRSISAAATGNDPYGDDFPSDSDADSTNQAGLYDNGVTASPGGGADASGSQLSYIGDASDPIISGIGTARASLYVQGSAGADAESRMRADFTLAKAQDVFVNGYVEVGQGEYGRDRPANASALIRITDRATGKTVYQKRARFVNGRGQTVNIDDVFTLPAGSYRALFLSTADDSASNEQVEGSDTYAEFNVELNLN